MTTRSVASVRRFFQSCFPERQLYHRSRGSVQFVILSAPAQIALLLLSLVFFGWVAYASVNVVFKDQIIAAKEQHFATMQAAYESRIAEMQGSLDEIHGALITTQDRFTSAASELETRHEKLSEILAHHEAALRDLSAVKTRVAQVYRENDTSGDSNRLVMTGEEAEPQLREPRAANSFSGGPSSRSEDNPVVASLLPINDVAQELPQPLAIQTRNIAGRFGTLSAAQESMIAELMAETRKTNRGLEKIVALTGLNVDHVLERVAETQKQEGTARAESEMNGQGGPYVPLQSLSNVVQRLRRPAAEDPALDQLKSTVNRLTALKDAFKALPLVTPLNVDYHISAGFGQRIDPITGRPAFHYGLDLAAHLNSPVLATAAGRVVYAARHGPYGNMVEIDHGDGIRTRYGHLNRIDVKVGDVVKFRQRIGLLGSTGRSTGPHVHYEVRFNGTLRNPMRFLEAGRYVFQG